MNVIKHPACIFSWGIPEFTVHLLAFGWYIVVILSPYSSTDLLSDGDSDEAGAGGCGGSLASSDITDAYSLEESDGGNEGVTSCPKHIASGPDLFSELHFWYVNPDGSVVRTKDEAAVTINGNETTYIHVHPCMYVHRKLVTIFSHSHRL